MDHLTEKQLKSFPAGRELDLLIAEYYGGHKWYKWQSTNGFFTYTCCALYKPGEEPKGSEQCASKPYDSVFPNNYEPQRYSTLISAAWTIVRQLKNGDYAFSLNDTTDSFWVATFASKENFIQHAAKTEMLAICQAALLLKFYEHQANS
jgi:hypothetical protein